MKRKSIAVALIATLVFPGAIAASIPECFIGRWKSNEALTLQDMRKHPEVTETARGLLEHNLFGKLVLVIGPNHTGAYFEGEQATPVIAFERNDVVESGTNWVTLRDRTLGVVQEQHWFCEEDRIYTLVTKWQFKEFFSPLP